MTKDPADLFIQIGLNPNCGISRLNVAAKTFLFEESFCSLARKKDKERVKEREREEKN